MLNRRHLFGASAAVAVAAIPVVATAQPLTQQSERRLLSVQSDNMIPLLNPGRDKIVVEPVAGWEGQGIYLLDMGDAECPYRCSRAAGRPGEIQVISDNPRYGAHRISLSQFERMQRGRVASAIRSFN